MAKKETEKKVSTSLRKGDPVMVVAGGNKNKRPNKGKVGKILRFAGAQGARVVVEGVNMITCHQKERGPNAPAGKIQREGSIHLSNVMYYAEKIKKPVRIKHKVLEDGKKVRGYIDPTTKSFTQI
jgi:large subunit ribosomal protein L24